MAFRQGPFGDVKVPLAFTAAAALVVAIIAALVLLMVNRGGETENGSGAQRAVDAVAAPVGGALSAPVRWVGAGFGGVRDYFLAGYQNRQLRKDLVEARQWQAVALAERDQNERLRALLGMRINPPIPTVNALSVTDSRGPFANTRLADAGSRRGVAIGNPVMSPKGFVGQVVGVAGDASRILLLTDVASRVPVMIDRNNARAILVGDGGPTPKLEPLRTQDPLRPGDRVVTSGEGGVIPRGLQVGVVANGLLGEKRVRLYTDAEPIDYVQILLFRDFAQLADQQALSVTQAPLPAQPYGGTPPAPQPMATPVQTVAAAPSTPRPAPRPAPVAPPVPAAPQ